MTSIIEKPLINGLSHLKNPAATLPTFIIEACCTSGRTYQSYKRGGEDEAKERFREEVTCGAFWLWGVKGLNKIGDFIGKKLFKLENLDIDVGKDALRDPFANIDPKLKNKTAIFKFGKIISSVILATGLLGFVVPKINHAITDRTLKNKKSKPQNGMSMDNFIQSTKNPDNSKYEPSFKGSEAFINKLMTASHKLENDNTWRLISTDTGMVAGRVYNSRHPAEKFEYLFRDVSSILFYNFTTGATVVALNKAFRTTNVHPKAIDEICEFLKANKFTKEQLSTVVNPQISEHFKNVNFSENGTITLKSLVNYLENMGLGQEIIDKATKMSELQPKLRGERILSRAQVQDVFSNSVTSNPEFLKNVINKATYGRATDSKKFVEAQTCQAIRESIDSFVKEIIKKAGNGDVTQDLLKKVKRNAILRTALFQVAGLAFSAFGLAILIPKTQIFLSQKIFGKKTFEDIANGNKKDGNAPS